MNGWLDGWITNLSLKKKHTCMHAYQNDNEQRERKNTLKEKTSQNKQKIPVTLQQTCRNSSKATWQFRNEQERESE